MAETLHVEVRESHGKRNARRMRQTGLLPAVLYGHGEQTVSLTLRQEEVDRVVRQGNRVFELAGAVQESAMLRELQWDPFGQSILHVDLMRVDAKERVVVSVPIECRGEAPGTKAGGVLSFIVHEIELEAPAASVPERLHLNVNSLEVGDALTAADIEDLPSDATCGVPSETVLVQCVARAVEEDEEAPLADSVEPEVIGRADEEAGAAEGGD